MGKKKLGDQDSEIVHRETLDNEDAILDGLDSDLGSLSFTALAEGGPSSGQNK